MTVNGFSMSCVDLQASGVPGTSTICTTSQGILGYVKVASDATELRNPELLLVPCGLAVRAATGRHGHQRHLRNLIGGPIPHRALGGTERRY